MNKFHKELFFATSNKFIWPKKNFNCMHGLKSVILAISQKLADWLDWSCPVSAAQRFHFRPQKMTGNGCTYQLLPIKYELKLPSGNTPGLLPFRSRSKQCFLPSILLSILGGLVLLWVQIILVEYQSFWTGPICFGMAKSF